MTTNRVANRDVRQYVVDRVMFIGSNLYAVQRNSKLYIVYSYGGHFPMYIYDSELGNWIYNTDKYSPTTSKHQTQANPLADNPIYMDTDGMHELIRIGSYVGLTAKRVNPEHKEVSLCVL